MSSSILPEDFEFISSFVMDKAAIQIKKGKESFVEARITPVARMLGFSTIKELVKELQKNNSEMLTSKIIEALATHETSFFRDSAPFDFLKDYILPELIEARKNLKELTVWCAAASSGQEPCSVAILIRENFPELLNWKINIIATDLSGAILDKARTGRYSQFEVNRGLSKPLLTKYFIPDGDGWKVKPEILNMISYKPQNLLHKITTVKSADIVLLRNVLIYFDVKTKQEILTKIREIMKPDGYLFLGAAETTIGVDDSFERILQSKTSCYRKKDN